MEFAEVARISDVREFSKGAKAVRDEMASVPHRPRYHFLPPANWMNDPNGALFWKGRYHLFYQHNPYAAYWANMHWGHAVSEDLVHWTDLPIALAPTPGGADEVGCWSGTAFVNKEGEPTLIYFGKPHGNCIATSHDDLLTWEKHPANPVIPHPTGSEEYRVFDPCAWIEEETTYSLSGGITPDGHDVASMFLSEDLEHWEYMHALYKGGVFTEKGEDCACPDFFPLGDRHMLLFTSHARGAQYYIGTYANHRFTPERHGRMQFAQSPGRRGVFCEGLTLKDENARRILFGRISEGRHEDVQRASGWSGVSTLPRVLSLSDDGTLRIDPATELAALRRNHRRVSDVLIGTNTSVRLEDFQGDCLEIAAILEGDGAEEFGLKVRCSPGGEEQTLVRYCPTYSFVALDISRSSVSDDVRDREPQTGSLELDAGTPLELRVFVDRSIVEVFANGRQCLTARIYPDRPDSLGVELFSRGGKARVQSLDAWEMASIWPVA